MSDNLNDIDRRINDLWSKGRFTDACGIIIRELSPALRDYLVTRNLTMEDAKDAVADVLLSFSKRISKKGPQAIHAPKPYLWRAMLRRCRGLKAKNLKRDIPESQLAQTDQEGRQPAPHAFLDDLFYNGTGSHLIPSWQKRATYLIEGLIEGIEIEESDAALLVRETLKRLPPPSAEIINHVLSYGADQRSTEAAECFGITKGYFRVRKTRAYKEFRRSALKVRAELGIQWRGLDEEQASLDPTEAPEFLPLQDDHEEPGENQSGL